VVEVSVIIPVYNVESYLRRCLDSICHQTFQDMEIICVNDCSTDGSGIILDEYAATDSRIRVLHNATNLKAGMSRNIGLQTASGKYVYFMDSDDYIDSGYLQQLYDNAEKYHADITINTSIWIDVEKRKHQYVHSAMPPVPDEGCYIDNIDSIEKTYHVVWIRLFRREFLASNQVLFESIDYAEDLIYSYIASLYAKAIFIFPGTSFYTYCRRKNSLSDITESDSMADFKTMQAYACLYHNLAKHHLLEDNKAKLFHVHPFFQVNTPEKYELYKNYFKKVKDMIEVNKEQYNDLELFFSYTILTSESFDNYKKKYPASVVMAFLKNKKNERILSLNE